jgi:hypothetical protein
MSLQPILYCHLVYCTVYEKILFGAQEIMDFLFVLEQFSVLLDKSLRLAQHEIHIFSTLKMLRFK